MKPNDLSSLLRDIGELLDSGDVDGATAQRDQLAKMARTVKASRTASFAKALAADFQLMMFERPEAQSTLSPYLLKKDPFVDEKALDRLNDAFAAAALRSACANALSRSRHHSKAFRIIRTTCKAFEGLHKASPEDKNIRIGQLWNLAYAARIAWRSRHDGALTQAYLDHCLDEIEHDRREQLLPAARLDAVEAFALDLKGFAAWVGGRIAEAEALATRALLILQRPPADGQPALRNRIRRAHALLGLGRITATLATPTSYWRAYGLFRESEELFHKDSHRLAWLAAIERVRVLIKGRNLPLAESELHNIRIPNDDQVLKAEYALTECWLNQGKDPAEQRRHAETIIGLASRGNLSRRLELEGILQKGIALVGSRERVEMEQGRSLLYDVLTQSEKYQRHRTTIACHLELADVERRLGHQGAAKSHIDHAIVLMPEVPSAHLRRRLVDLVGSTTWIHIVESDNWKRATEAFAQQFFRVQIKRAADSIGAAARQTGASPTTIKKYVQGLR